MAGLRNAERGKTRRLILQEATDYAALHGLDALTISSLCEVTAFPPARVRYYFGNTGMLLFHVLDPLLLATLNSLEAPPNAPPRDGLVVLSQVYATARATGVCRHLSQVPYHLIRPAHVSVLRFRQRLILQAFLDAIRGCRPAQPPDDAMVRSLSLIALLDGYAAWSREPGAMDPATYAGLACRMALAA